jgi:hypothetical protein
MSTSQRTFDQVKSILGKLDRDIDAARQKRLQTRPTPPAMAAPGGATMVGGGTGFGTARPLSTPGLSGFGRATPLRSDGRNQG